MEITKEEMDNLKEEVELIKLSIELTDDCDEKWALERELKDLEDYIEEN